MGTSCTCFKAKSTKVNNNGKKQLADMNTKIEDYHKEMDKKINYYGEKINALNNSLEYKKK